MESGNDKQSLFIENLPDPIACCRITTSREGRPLDCIFLDVNPAFEKMVGLTKDKIAGQQITKILPGIESSRFDLFTLCSEAETADKSIRFEQFIEPPGKWYEITAFKETPGFIAIIFRNISNYRNPERTQPGSKMPELEEIIDASELQSLIEEFYSLIKLPISILDLKGKVLAGVGWQDICTKFHRVHPETRKNCLESDIRLSSNVSPGKYKIYKCNNNMLDIVTPVVVDDSHVGNVFMGQFFFEDEPLDFELFRAQAQQYGFDEEKYITALKQVPRYSRETVQQAMNFFAKLAHLISLQGYANLKIKHTLKEHEKAKMELEKSRFEYKNLVENLNEGIAIADDKENLLYVNPASEKTFGVEAGELMGKNIKEYLNMENFQKVIAQTQNRKQGQSGSYELDFFKADGSRGLIKVSASPRFDGDQYIGSFVVFQDITERKKTEKRLEEEFNLRNALLDNIPNCIALILKKDTREIVASNRAGHEIGAVPGKTCFQTCALRDDHCPFCRAPEMWKSGQLQQIEVKYRGIWYEGIWAPLSKDLYVHYIFDITERKKTEEALKLQARERTAVDTFTYSVSNDLQAPLRRIEGFSEMLIEECPEQLNEQARDYLNRIITQIDSMKALTDALLQLSRVVSRDIEKEAVNLSALTRSHLAKLHYQEPGRQVEVVIAPKLAAEGDADLLKILLANLLDNAWKFSSGMKEARIEFGSTKQDGRTVYYLKDNGAGFDMNHAEKLFTPFHKLHSEKEYPGIGIGLNLVYRIISRHGGEIWAEGEPGKGACFFFTLP